MFWVLAIIFSLLLFAIVCELTYIITLIRQKSDALSKQLRESSDELRSLVQEKWEESLNQLSAAITSGVKEGLPPLLGAGDPAEEKAEAYKSLLDAAKELSDASSRLNSVQATPGVDVSKLLAEATVPLGNNVKEFSKEFSSVMKSGVEEMTDELRKLIGELASQSHAQQTELKMTLLQLETVLQYALRMAEPQSTAPTPPAATKMLPAPVAEQPAEPSQPTVKRADDSQAKEKRAEQAPPEDKTDSGVTQASEGFEPLHRWVLNNLEQIMNRSLNRWSKPEDLMKDVPEDISYTARLLDPGAKLVLIGHEGDSRYLALALPGGQIDNAYYEWFGPLQSSGRVGRTETPALLDAGPTGYRVLQRGVIKQD